MRMHFTSAAIGLAGLLMVSAGALHADDTRIDPNETVIDFNKLRPGPLIALDHSEYTITATPLVKIAPSPNPGISGQVLTSDAPTGNRVVVVFHQSRKTIDLEVVPDPAGRPATIEFLKEVTFDVLHSIEVKPGSGPQHLSFTAPGNIQLQGITWTGAKLSIDNVRQHYSKKTGSN